MDKQNRVRYYETEADDFFSDGAGYTLPPDYRWVRTDLPHRALSAVVYGVALLLSAVWCRFFLHVRFRGADKLRAVKKGGFFLYGNHTQPVGDVFIPAHACFPGRIYTVVSPANYALPVIGKLLPYLGALPLAQTLNGQREFQAAVGTRLEKNHPIVIYPEAHVWPYYTGIRPFSAASFKLPVRFGVPAYSMTATYQKRRFGKKPRITVYIDGPFMPKGEGAKAKAESLRDAVYARMTERSRESNYSYIVYQKKDPQ